MAESEIKQVTVELSHPDELNPRRRRRTRKFKDDVDSQAGGAASVGAVGDTSDGTSSGPHVTVQKEIPTTTVSSNPTVAPVHSTSPVQNVAPVQPVPSMAAMTMVGGAAPSPQAAPGAVQIREKKNAGASGAAPGKLNAPNAHVSPAPAPKIVPHKKRLTSAPVAQTLKKPKFVVGGGAAPAATSEKPTPPPAPKNATISGGVGGGGVDLKPAKGGGGTVRRRFTERRIKIEVKPTVKTRKSRKVLKERIASMPIQAVRRLLIKKGILKPKATVPPEPMMRSMLHDYYLLKQSE